MGHRHHPSTKVLIPYFDPFIFRAQISEFRIPNLHTGLSLLSASLVKLICGFLVQTQKLSLTFSFWQWQKKGAKEGEGENLERLQEGWKRKMGEKFRSNCYNHQALLTCHWSLTTILLSDWLMSLISSDLNCVSPLCRFKSKKGGDSGNLATQMVLRFPFI